MIPNEEIDQLADEMKRRHGETRHGESQSASSPDEQGIGPEDPERQPFVLFLGPKCAAAAGVPGKEHLARLILDFVAGDDELASVYPVVKGSVKLAAAVGGEEKLLRLFYELMGELTKTASSKINRMLLKLYANVPVPLFYQDLALLIRAGYFERILTTNIDTLLEQALDIAGLQAGYDYQVTSLGVAQNGAVSYDAPPEWGESARQKQIIKLFGDLSQEQVNIDPSEIDRALKSRRRYVKSELEGDIVMVGYDLESKPINEWLEYGGSRRGQLWWAAEDGPPQTSKYPVGSWARQMHFITGSIGGPQEFFSQLKLRLLRRPTFKSVDAADYSGGGRRRRGRRGDATTFESLDPITQGSTREVTEGIDAPEGGEVDTSVTGATRVSETGADTSAFESATVSTEAGEAVVPPEELSLIEDLRGNIRRGQAVLFSLEQTAATGDLPASARAQIAYQKQQIAEMEDKIRSLTSSRHVVTQTLEAILQDVQTARATGAAGTTGRPIEESTVLFLQRQHQLVRDEYARGEPNHFVVAAAVGATVMLAERLCIESGPEAVKLEHVRRLAAYAPSVAGRGVI